MATHYTCDRCGEPCGVAKVVAKTPIEVHIDWPDDPKPHRSPEMLAVSVTIQQPYADGDEPDLCSRCRAQILQLAANALTPAAEPARGALMASTCYVSAIDHGIHWQGVAAVPPPVPSVYSGPERRSGIERRQLRDRRGDAMRGRRYRVTDRRRRVQ